MKYEIGDEVEVMLPEGGSIESPDCVWRRGKVTALRRGIFTDDPAYEIHGSGKRPFITVAPAQSIRKAT